MIADQTSRHAGITVARWAYDHRVLVAVGTFTVAAVLIVLLPGPDTLVVVRGMLRGRRVAVLTACGVVLGNMIWVGATSLGLAALLKASEVGYNVLRIAGAIYLVYLGVQSLRGAIRRHRGAAPQVVQPVRKGLLGSGFAAGLLTDLLNPKLGVFMVSFLPGFVPAGYPVGWTTLLFGTILVALTALYFTLLIALSGRVATWMQTPRIRRRLDATTGAILVGFGIKLATES
jgi:threonine/homoserine/homoserine lactone efflux protein